MHDITFYLDKTECVIWFVVKILADITWNRAESNISLSQSTQQLEGQGASVQQIFYHANINE